MPVIAGRYPGFEPTVGRRRRQHSVLARVTAAERLLLEALFTERGTRAGRRRVDETSVRIRVIVAARAACRGDLSSWPGREP